MDPIIQGLEISILGLAVTFTALGLFILVMLVLQRVFRVKPESISEQQETTNEVTSEPSKIVAEDDSELVAVITAAISHLRSKNLSALGSSLENGKGNWWTANRMNASQGTRKNVKRSV